ncbi:FCD domain-containing protein [Pseudenhygromyxa sp. WMMC2535]|uniref:GntR family transcriptional regulator n=1 Tax=Pseudenhygromyxa sp. WMMC2535 TaxID=2712867 RepID=UPI001552AC32|nr:FCD domain-containing protein [Pseudenhygromyxa sp. WMMC2535]NVB37597.1 FCD domain-containing protein [Pseudenhygromyxa sp. WMMC2535]
MDQPIRRTEASVATDRLRAEIVEGRVAPGAKLKLVSLAERYEMSRGPLREAASRLAAEGWVTSEDQRGFRVAPISRADLLDLTQTRQRIELLALRDAIEHGDLVWEGRVMAACHVLERVTNDDPSPAARAQFVEPHHAFHQVLVEACPSNYLLRFREHLYALTERYRNLASQSDAGLRGRRDVAAEHQAIAEATVSRNPDQACEALAAHLGETAEVLISAYPQFFGAPK